MGIVIKSKNSDVDHEPIPPGNYLGVIIGLYDIGTQDGQYGKKHQIITITELHKKRGPAVDSKGRIFTIPNFYSLSFSSMNGKKSKLRSDVETITGHVFTDEEAENNGFDVQGLIGLPYRLAIVENVRVDGKRTSKITSIMRLDEDDTPPTSESDETYFELHAKEPIPAHVPRWIIRFIEKSAEWVAVHGQPRPENSGATAASTARPAADDDDPPF